MYKCSVLLVHLILTTVCGECYYYPHFTDRKMGSESFRHFARVPQLVRIELKSQTKPIGVQGPHSVLHSLLWFTPSLPLHVQDSLAFFLLPWI